MITTNGRASGLGESPYELLTNEGGIVFIENGNFIVGIAESINNLLTGEARFGTVKLNNGNGKINYNSMKKYSDFPLN